VNEETKGGSAGSSKPRKAERTRSLILETALRLFRERGYEGTTMRGIAAEAEVSLGSAYYYFKSKEHLIQAYYERSQAEHLAACREILEQQKDFKARLRGVIRAKIEISAPFHRFAGQLFKTAADPSSPLSPFSPESMPVRQEATELMAKIVSGSDIKISAELKEELPNLLWLYLMGIILFWIHDASKDCRRTYLLIDRTVDIVVRFVRLYSLAPIRPLFRGALRLLGELRDFPEVSVAEVASEIEN